MRATDLTLLGKKYDLVLWYWNGGISVKTDKPIHENEFISKSRPYFFIRNVGKRWKVYLSGLLSLEPAGEIIDTTFFAVKSASLKCCGTIDGALAWINRFRALNDDEQDEFLSRHNITPRDNNLVTIMADYFRLDRSDKRLNSTLRISSNVDLKSMTELKQAMGNDDSFTLRRTVRRSFTLTKSDLKDLSDKRELTRLSIHAAKPFGSDMGVANYNNSPKRNRSSNFWNKK